MKTGFVGQMVSSNYELLKASARRMRREPTEAERLLWQVLKGDRFGVRFRHQHIVGDYIADFACLSRGIIIEIDGGYHNDPEQQSYDELRTGDLAARGFKVLRFTNDKVINNLEHVIRRIEEELECGHDGQSPSSGGI